MNAFDRRVWGHLLCGLGHAFALSGQPDQLDEDDLALLDRFARLLADRGLATPAIFLVESLAPLGFVGSQLVHALAPIMGMIAPPDDIERLARLLERREAPAIFADRLRSLDGALRLDSGQAPRPGSRQGREAREEEAGRR